nr:Arginyl-tRNA--protein transferase 1 [Polyrhizophydium stewartii]
MSSGASRSSTTSSSTSSGGGSAASARVPDSYVAITGESTSKCGYCSREDSSHTYGMWAYRLSPHVYQDLIDHGWRRSGQYLYKPAMHQTCCPAYTIRLDATRFQPTRSQKKVARKMRRFLADGVLPGSSGSSTGATGASASAAAAVEAAAGDEDEEMGDDAPAAEQFLAPARAVPSLDTAPPGSAPASSSSPAASPRKPTHVDLATNAAPAEAASAAAGDARGAAEEASPHGVRRTTPKAKKPKVGQKPGPSFADLIAQTESATEASRHRLRIELVPAQFHQDTFDLYKKYQVAIHKDPPSRITESQFTQFLVDSPITFEAVPPRSDAESQTQQHQQKQQQRQQQQRETTGGTDEPPPRGYGSFHQKYYLDDGRLIAVAVLDVLPKCLSSVYFMYDPDFGRLSLGSYSALHEIAFTLSLRGQMPPGLDYYYMGEKRDRVVAGERVGWNGDILWRVCLCLC